MTEPNPALGGLPVSQRLLERVEAKADADGQSDADDTIGLNNVGWT